MNNNLSSGKFYIYQKRIGLFFLIFSILCISGCSLTNRYKTLSFFFDGVPINSNENHSMPNDSLSLKDTTLLSQNTALKNNVPVINFHTPYKETKCSSCHNQGLMGVLNKEIPELCYQCHIDFSKKYKTIHAPIEGGQCLSCHNPHSSKNKSLLIRIGQALCLECHNYEDISKSEIHQDIKDTDCIDCHNPHGGDNKNILR